MSDPSSGGERRTATLPVRGLRWEHDRLGRSLPIAGGLRRSALVLTVLALAALAPAGWAIYRAFVPAVEPLSETDATRAARERLASVELPPWNPGGELPAVEPPGFVESPPPEPWPGRHPRDPAPADPARAARAWQALEDDDPQVAAGLYKQLVEATPSSWSLRYNLGIALLRSGLYGDAYRAFSEARERLGELAPTRGDESTDQAIIIATHYAAAAARSRDDCPEAISHLKSAVSGLKRYLELADEPVFSRDLPFAVAPSSLSSLAVRNRLAQEYLACEGRYPDEYFERGLGSYDFNRSEYRDGDVAEIREGPFPAELAECVASNGATARCWALSNLNGVYWANRELYPEQDGDSLPRAYRDHGDDLARLAINVAILAAASPDEGQRQNAARCLRQARRLDQASGRIDLGEEIDRLGRYLAGRGDNTALAEPYRGLPADRLPFAQADDVEVLKGLAQAFREALEAELEAGRPERVVAAFDTARQTIPGAHLDALGSYRGEVEETLQHALAGAVRDARRRGDFATALALRQLDAPYLGDGWPRRALRAWITGGAWARVLAIAAAWLVFAAALVLLHRYLVYPYLLYTTDYYKTEFQHRYARRHRDGKPMTGEEMRKRRIARDRG